MDFIIYTLRHLGWEISNTSTTFFLNEWTRYHTKKIFSVYLKHSNIWPSADVKLRLNYRGLAMPWQCMFALSKCMLRSQYQCSMSNLHVCVCLFVQCSCVWKSMCKKLCVCVCVWTCVVYERVYVKCLASDTIYKIWAI